MSVLYDGTNYLSFGSTHLLDATEDEFSVACWMYSSEADVTDLGPIVCDFGKAPFDYRGWHLSIQPFVDAVTRDLFQFGVYLDDAADQNAATSRTLITVSSANNSARGPAWFHVCGTFRRNSAVKLYIDGVEVASTAIGDYPMLRQGNYQGGIGWKNFGLSASDLLSVNQRVAEVGVWDIELSADRVAALAAGLVPPGVPGGLRYYWPLHVISTARDLISGVVATEGGAGALATAEHAPVFYPTLMPFMAPAAAGGAFDPANGFPWTGGLPPNMPPPQVVTH